MKTTTDNPTMGDQVYHQELFDALNRFLGKAVLRTYAGDGPQVTLQRQGLVFTHDFIGGLFISEPLVSNKPCNSRHVLYIGKRKAKQSSAQTR